MYKKRRRSKTATRLTIKKHFVRFNLHFKLRKKWVLKRKTPSSCMRLSGRRAFLWFYTLFIYGLTVSTNCEALMIKYSSCDVCRMKKCSLYSWWNKNVLLSLLVRCKDVKCNSFRSFRSWSAHHANATEKTKNRIKFVSLIYAIRNDELT